MATVATFTPPSGHPPRHFARWRCRAVVSACGAVGTLLNGCSVPRVTTASMALADTLVSETPARFEGLSGGRTGQFTLDGQAVRFQRMGDTLSLMDRLRTDRVSVQFEHAGHLGRCDGRGASATAGVVAAPLKPLELRCQFTGPAPGELVLREQPLAAAGTRQSREGQATVGSVVLDIRSEHALQGSPLPLAQPAGYRIIYGGRDIAALELTDGAPTLRRVAGLDEPVHRAVTQVALALGLLFDPAVTAR